MRVIIRDDKDATSKYVADYIIHRIETFAPTPEKPFVLGLPTGSSPEGVYHNLVQAHKRGEISFRNVITFNMDEYVGLPRAHPESYFTFMHKHFFDHVDILPCNIHLLDGNAADLEAECLAYEAMIADAGGIELFLGGIGSDGHLAFNEPGSSLRSRTRIKTLAFDTLRANARFFQNDPSRVPKMALTVGLQTVFDAREVVVIITGEHKAVALQRCIEGGVSHMWPLSCLQMHPHALLVVDEDATLELQVKTVRYFKSIEQIAASEGFTQVIAPAEHLRKKRDSVLDKLAGAEMATSTLRVSEPEANPPRAITPELVPEPMHDRLKIETNGATNVGAELMGSSSNLQSSTVPGLAAPPAAASLVRSTTPELFPEPMHARIP